MIRKVFKIFSVSVLIIVLLLVLTKAYMLFVTRKLPWQKPIFDTQLPPFPGDIGKAGVLIFTKTNGFRHSSIEPGVAAIVKAGRERGWNVYHTESGAFFNDDYLSKFKVVVFLSTSGDVLTQEQQNAFERWFKSGGGYVGIHSAADTEHDWRWYDSLLGTHFKEHPILPRGIAEAEIVTNDREHPITKFLPATWKKKDEWYNYKSNVTGKNNIDVLLMLNEDSYISWISTSLLPSKKMGSNHPISWTNCIGCGRMFYTGMGHTAETFSNKYAMAHILAGIEWAGQLSR